MRANTARLTIGAQYGPCVIRELIGRSKKTAVYRAFHPDLRRDVALKILRPSVEPTPHLTTCFRQQAQAIAGLKHPNIMRVHAYGSDGETYYIVMDFIIGSNLRDTLATRPNGLDRDTTVRIFSQLASAVAAAHDHTVTHGNIKPDNVLIDVSQRPILTDFNIPCLLEQVDNPDTPNAPAYLAPETTAQNPMTIHADIYALGIVLYEMVTGDVPFKGKTLQEVMAQHQHAEPKPPSQMNINIDPRIEQVILTALSKDPAARYGSAREMVSALESGEAADQFETLSLKRERVRARLQKRQSDIVRFEEARLADRDGARSARRDLSSVYMMFSLLALVVAAVAVALLLV